jgi:hAT family C-terminal dimerisation region
VTEPKKKKNKRRNSEEDDDQREGPVIDDEVPGHDESDNKKRNENLRKAWRALDAVGKAHNIVLWVRGKPQHRSAWKNKYMKHLRNELLQADNVTRWGSTWNMLHVFLRQRERVEEYVDMIPELKDDRLTESDWKDLKDVLRLLEPFKKLTVLGEERGTLYGSVGSVLWGFDILLEKLEKERKKSRPSDAPYQRALDASWAKLCKYYKLTDESLVYVVAGMLDPRMKYQYFERRWESDWLAGVMSKMRFTFNQYQEKEPTPDILQNLNSKKDDDYDDDDEDSFDLNKWRFGDTQQIADELTRYLAAPVLTLDSAAANDAFNALEWWKGNEMEYPTLARIAFNVFSVPSMSVEPERVFSGYVSILNHTH